MPAFCTFTCGTNQRANKYRQDEQVQDRSISMTAAERAWGSDVSHGWGGRINCTVATPGCPRIHSGSHQPPGLHENVIIVSHRTTVSTTKVNIRFLTDSFNALAAENAGVWHSLICIGSPVFGWRPSRPFRYRVSKVPNPTRLILSPSVFARRRGKTER